MASEIDSEINYSYVMLSIVQSHVQFHAGYIIHCVLLCGQKRVFFGWSFLRLESNKKTSENTLTGSALTDSPQINQKFPRQQFSSLLVFQVF